MRWPRSSALTSALNEQGKQPKYTCTPNTQAKKNYFRIHFHTRKVQLRYIMWFSKRSCFTQFYNGVSEANGGQDACLRSRRANSWAGFGVPGIPLDHKPLCCEQHCMLMVSSVSVATSFLSKGKLLRQACKALINRGHKQNKSGVRVAFQEAMLSLPKVLP